MVRELRKSKHRRKLRIWVAAVASVLSVSALGLAGATQASADTAAVQHVYATGGEGLY